MSVLNLPPDDIDNPPSLFQLDEGMGLPLTLVYDVIMTSLLVMIYTGLLCAIPLGPSVKKTKIHNMTHKHKH